MQRDSTHRTAHQFVAAEQLLGCCFARVPRNVQQEPIAQPAKARRTLLILRDKTGSISALLLTARPPPFGCGACSAFRRTLQGMSEGSSGHVSLHDY